MTTWFKNHGMESLKDFCVFESNKFGYEHLQMASYYEDEWTDCKILCMYWDQTDEQGESAESKVGKNVQETPSWKLSSGLATGTFCFCKQSTVLQSLFQLKVTVYLWI